MPGVILEWSGSSAIGGGFPGLKLGRSPVELVSERMRDALNSNPLVQAAVIGVLLLGGIVFFVSSSGGGRSEGEAAGTAEATTGAVAEAGAPEAAAGAEAAATPEAASASSLASLASASAPPPPRPVLAAWSENKTLVLLFVRDGGIDDRLVKTATDGLAGFSDAAIFVVPAAKISRYAAITEGVGVDRVPALVVVTPKHLKKTVPTASVSYGFQSAESVRQAVIDAGYKGPTLDYHP
jgi:hypothetical protein